MALAAPSSARERSAPAVVASGRVERRWGRALGGVGGVGLALSCQVVLGFEDLSGDPRPDAGVEAPGAAGGGGALEPGSSGAGGGAAVGGGAGGDAVSHAGSSGDPDAGPVGPFVVNGRVIDFFRRPVPGVPVSIGEQTVATSVDGRFSIAGVEAPYDAKLILATTRFNSPSRYGYVYEGLTRADPTLQVDSALAQRSSISLDVTLQNAELADDTERMVILGFASPDARFVEPSIQSEVLSILGEPAWTGPVAITGPVHALRVISTEGFAGSRPAVYEGHRASTLSASDGAVAELALDVQASLVPTATITGSVAGGTLDARSNGVAVRFDDGAVLPIIDESGADPTFEYLVPAFERSTITVAAVDGIAAPYAVAWRDGLAPGTTDIALTVPNPVNLAAPQADAPVTPRTPYSWSSLGQTARTFVWHLEFRDTFEGMLVITARTQIELPTFADGFTVPAGTPYSWSVETHGDARTVDALAGPDGFLAPFAVVESYPIGSARGSGYYTESARRSATMGSD